MYTYKEILDLEKSQPTLQLRLHWEGDSSEAAKVTPWRVIDDIRDGVYSADEFDEFAYCILEEDYGKEDY